MDTVSITPESLLGIARSFPATPQVLAELGVLLKKSDVDLRDIAKLLKRDSALTARLIKLGNSAAFAQAEPVASVEVAVNLAGFQEVHRLVGVALLEQFGDEGLVAYGVPSRRLRENSLFTALLMEELAKPAGEDPRTAYTIGLLRSIGKLALDRLARTHAPAARFAPEGEALGLAFWERAVFGMTNVEAATTILNSWRFPHETVKSISEHYAPAGRHLPYTHLLNLAANMADKIGYGLPGESGYWLETDEVYRKAGVEMREAKPFIDRAHIVFDRLLRSNF
jgi:HD-like signal output (HDOD) protein